MGRDRRPGGSVAEMTDLADPSGQLYYRRVSGDLAGLLATGTPARLPDMIALVGMLFLLSYPRADIVEQLGRLTWGDGIDWDARCLILRDATGARVELPLAPLAELALIVLRRNSDAFYILASPGRGIATTPRTIVAMLRRTMLGFGVTQAQVRVMAARLQREVLPGTVVASILEGTEPHTPIADGNWRVIQAYVDNNFQPPERTHAAPLEAEPGRSRGTFRPAPRATIDEILRRAQRAIRTAPRGNLGLRSGLYALAVEMAAGAPVPFDTAIRNHLAGTNDRGLAVAAHAGAGSEQGWRYNCACALLYIAYRAERPAGTHWFDGEGKQSRPRRGTLESYLNDLIFVIRLIGNSVLTDWTPQHWAIVAAKRNAAASAMRLRTPIAQFRRYVSIRLGLTLRSGWVVDRPPETRRRESIPSPELINQLFDALSEDEMADDLLMLAGMILAGGLRIAEAKMLLARDVDLFGEGCWVSHVDTKRHHGHWVPMIYSLPRFVVSLQRRLAEVEMGRWAHTPAHEPPLLRAAEDRRSLGKLTSRLRTILTSLALRPHQLRHLYATLRRAAAIVWRESPDTAWPTWVGRAGKEMNSLIGTALALDHVTPHITRMVYDQTGLWLVMHTWERHAQVILRIPARKVVSARWLRISDAQLRTALGNVSASEGFALGTMLTAARALAKEPARSVPQDRDER